MYGVIPRDVENSKGKFPASFDTYQAVEPGDLVFCLFDIDETPRTVGIVTMSGMLSGAYTRTRCRDDSLTKYLYYYYRALDDGKCLRPLYSGLRKVIRKTVFLSCKTPVPPLEERVAIVAFIERRLGESDAAIAKAERELGLLAEYRARLIGDVVTGKVNVRGVAKDLPDAASSPISAPFGDGDEGADLDALGMAGAVT